MGQAYTFSFTVDAPFGVKGDMTATLAGEALTVTEEEGVYTVTIPVEKVTGDKLTVTISGVDNQGKAITRTVEIPVQCRDGAHHHHDGERQDRGCCV